MMRSRVQDRQAQIERKAQGRQRAMEQAAGQTPHTPLSTPAKTVIPLMPRLAILGAVWIVSWVMLVQHFRRFKTTERFTTTDRFTTADLGPSPPDEPPP
jgi:hypothetical protein